MAKSKDDDEQAKKAFAIPAEAWPLLVSLLEQLIVGFEHAASNMPGHAQSLAGPAKIARNHLEKLKEHG